jgi:bilirubin oxidase
MESGEELRMLTINRSRRHFLQLSAALSAGLVMPQAVWSAARSFNRPLPIPPLLEATPSGDFRLQVQRGMTSFLDDVETATLGYNGSYLGPTLRMKRADTVAIHVNNELAQSTTVHWHGMVLPARMDGGPHQMIEPGASWTSRFTVRQRAATLFYHSHAHRKTGQQVYHGLGGMLIVDDDESLQSGLPSEYGVDDVPVILQDRDFSSAGQFQYLRMMPERMMGKHGNSMLVNGAISPVFKAQKPLLRLRLLNASNARFYTLVFSDNRPFQVIASDGGLLQQAQTVNKLVMAPAERYEILLDVSDGKQVMLRSLGGAGNVGQGMMAMMMGGRDRDFDLLLIDPSAVRGKADGVAKILTRYDDWSKVAVANTRKLDLEMGMGGMRGGGMMGGGMMRINGKAFDMQRIDFAAPKDSFEVWEISNPSMMIHPFHIHNTQFRIISRNGNRPAAHESGYKDTVVVNRDEVVRVLVPTGPYADARQPYMFHCHILEHEDGGMMGQFVVT